MSKKKNRREREEKHIESITKSENLKGLDRFLYEAIKYLNWGMFLVPFLVLNVILYPYTFAKTLAFYTLIEVILGFYLVLAYRQPQFRPRFLPFTSQPTKESYRWIFYLLSIYILVAAIANFFSADPFISFWGNMDWSNGLLTALHFFAWLVILISVFRTKRIWVGFMRIFAYGGIPLAIYSMTQKIMGKEFFATFGNWGYLAGYMVMVAGISLILYFWEENIWLKRMALIALGFSSAAILFVLQTRAAQLGLIIGAFAGAFLYGITSPKKNFRRASWAGAIIVVVIAVSSITYIFTSKSDISKLFQRSSSVRTRLVNWNVAMKGIKERPLTGFGMESYYIVFEKYFDPTYYNQEGSQGRIMEFASDTPHNKVLEVAVTSGLPALLFYLGIFILALILLGKKYRDQKDWASLVMFGTLVGYFVNNLFLFDTIAVQMGYYFILSASIFVLARKETEDLPEKPVRASVIGTWIAGGVALMLVLFMFSNYVVKPAKAARAGLVAVEKVKAGNYKDSFSELDKIKQLGYFPAAKRTFTEISRDYETTFSTEGKLSAEEMGYLKKMAELDQYVIERNPYQIFTYISLIKLYNVLGATDPAYYQKSLDVSQQALDKGSRRPEIYFLMVESYIALKQYEKAVATGEAAIQLNPIYPFSYYSFAIAYFDMGNKEKGLEYLDKAIDLGINDETAVKKMVELSLKDEDYPRAIKGTQLLIKLNPKDQQMWANLAMMYFKNQEFEKAKEAAMELGRKFPSLRNQAEQFIEQVDQQRGGQKQE